jgi:hypothetical protein
MSLLVQKQLAAPDTYTTQDIADEREELKEIDWAGKAIMTKVTGASVIGLAAGTTCLAIVQNTHTGIKESTNLRFISFICILRGDFYDGTSLNLLRTENSELNPNNRFNLRSRSIETCGHLLFYLSYFSKPPQNQFCIFASKGKDT